MIDEKAVKTNLKLAVTVVITAVLSAGSMFTFWLYTDNARMTEEIRMLKVDVQVSSSEKVETEAQSLELRQEAARNNVFLPQ